MKISQQEPYADWGSAQYLDTVSRQPEVQAYKCYTFTLLGVQAGHHLLDVGCGTGEDVRALARLVGSNGRVVGLDIREELFDEACKRTADTDLPIEYWGLVKNALFIFTLRNASYGPGSPIHLASGQFRNHKSVKQL
jgi:trans-aconitate methyltransferase